MCSLNKHRLIENRLLRWFDCINDSIDGIWLTARYTVYRPILSVLSQRLILFPTSQPKYMWYKRLRLTFHPQRWWPLSGFNCLPPRSPRPGQIPAEFDSWQHDGAVCVCVIKKPNRLVKSQGKAGKLGCFLLTLLTAEFDPSINF